MLLTVEQYRQFDPAAAFEDEAIQLLLDAAEADIARVAGTSAVTEFVRTGGRLTTLRRPAASITSITETPTAGSPTTLATDDYLLWPAGTVIERLTTGTNPRSWWLDRTTVVYAAAEDEELRKAVQAGLVKLDLTYAPGVTMEQIGSWTEQRATPSQGWSIEAERQDILSRLTDGRRMVVV